MLNRYRCRTLFALALLPLASLSAQVAVTGTITDSVSHRPLAGALVQLAAESARMVRGATSDSLGVYRIDSVPAGSYIIGFFHPALDSLGIDLLPMRVTVDAGSEKRVDLAIPPAEKVALQLCGAKAPTRDSTGLMLGHLRDAETGQPRKGTVTVLWMELLLGQGGVTRNRQQIPIKTDDMGYFAVCGLPSDVDLEVSAQAADEESGVVDVRVPAAGLVKRDFLVSRDSLVPVHVDSASLTLGAAPASVLRRGTARVSGVVRNYKGKPVGNVAVSVPGTGVEARTQESGAFALAGLPSGTQTVEVRAIGFEPKRFAVDLSRGRLTTLDVALDRPLQTLDAVKIFGTGNRSLVEFERRLKSGFGHFLTPGDIAKRNAVQASELFRMIPGVRVAPTRRGFGNTILLRGCAPTVYLNGMRMDDRVAGEIDDLVTPNELTAIEVYTVANRPVEFYGNNCGSVVIWAGMLPR